jgi:hypothetical protein
MKTSLRVVVVFAALFGFATASHAATITFTVSGTASGQLGASLFTNAAVIVTVTADPANAQSETQDHDGDGIIETIYGLPSSVTTVSIAGLGTVTVLDDSAVFEFPGLTNVDPGEELLHMPAFIVGTLDSPGELDSFTGLAGIATNALAGYALATSFGPIVGAGGIGYPAGLFVVTSGGNLSFTDNIGIGESTFAATLSETAPVPEPASLTLLASGMLSLGGLARFRKRA